MGTMAKSAALFYGVVVPLVSTSRDAVVAGEAFVQAFVQKPFAPAEEKGF